jgi:fatty-acid peroxygenase
MRLPRVDDSLQLLRKGYAWMPDRRRVTGQRTVSARFMGMPAVGLEGPEAARFFYDEDHVRRHGALPEPVLGTLFGKGAVHTLDGELHRVRKAMFVDLLMGAGIERLVQQVTAEWKAAVPRWAERDCIAVLDEAARVLTVGVCSWGGVPLGGDEVAPVARDLLAMVDGFVSAGPRHWRARRARGRRQRWLAGLVEEVRSGERTAAEGCALAVVSRHRDAEGQLLTPKVAAVELLNIIRPTVAISWFVAFAGEALLRWPAHRTRLVSGETAFAEAFADEVRRFYPFAPFVGGVAPRALEFDGQQIPQGAMVLLDLYGQSHDPALWEDPYAFRPERFLDRAVGSFDFIPQGGGDPRTGHRCPGEQVVVALLAALSVELARLEFDVPEQDLDISLRRIPARPADGVLLRVRRTSG